MAETHPQKSGLRQARRMRRGSAMLELILVLPTYVMLLFILMTLSEMGQVASQTYTAGRVLAWERRGRNDRPGKTERAARVHAEFFEHFARRIRVKTGGGRQVVPMQEDGEYGGGYSMGNASLVVAGAHAYPYRTLADPLYLEGGQSLDPEYQDDAAGAHLAGLAELAMRGSDTPPAGQTVPWLRRHYSSVWVTYYPVDDLFGLRIRFNNVHTVLRSATCNSADHAPYRLTGHPGTLRDVEGYPYPDVVNLRSDNHQLELLGAEHFFSPGMP